MTKRDFHQLIEKAVAAAVATTAVTLVGCGGVDLDGFSEAPCDLGISSLNPTTEVDYAKLVGSAWRFTSNATSGEPCATATNRQSCLEALEAAEVMVDNVSLITTFEDSVEVYETREELMDFLGTIDTEGEAVLLAWWSGYDISCDDLEQGAVKTVGGGFEVIATRMVQSCSPVEIRQYRLLVKPDGDIDVLEDERYSIDRNTCVGRRPDGFEPAEGEALEPCAEYWSTTAHLEAAAVEAFEVLAWELERFGAPQNLVERALRAADEEREHTVSTRSVARQFGGVFVSPQPAPRRERTLLEFAIENATEGCVRETFGAAVGSFQARVARHESVAEVMEKVSREETGHAALSWEIAAWVESRLTADELEQVRVAQQRAVRALVSSARIPIPISLVVDAALPTPDQGIEMIEVLREGLWNAA